MKLRILLASVALAAAVPAAAETLDNATVVQLASIGLGDEAIIAKIQASPSNFDVTTDALITLKQDGVSSAVIAAMIEASNTTKASSSVTASIDSPDPMVPHPSGVYMLADWLEKPNRGGGNFWVAGAVTSPAEFSLVEFKVKKNRREAKVGKFNIGGAKAGVMDKDQIGFDYERIAPGVFEVTPQADLQPGEYGFIYSSSTGGGTGAAGVGAQTSRIFDFSIEK